ncbi:MAG TPA: hypothetical protein VM639_05285 [Dongiaceae bacterium]|nr:hypothetical protein [Dongiaceae bacterium]
MPLIAGIASAPALQRLATVTNTVMSALAGEFPPAAQAQAALSCLGLIAFVHVLFFIGSLAHGPWPHVWLVVGKTGNVACVINLRILHIMCQG